MNVFSKVTLESLKKNRTRTVVTIIGVLLSVALITAVTTFVSSLQNYLIQGAQERYGGWHVAFFDADKTFVEKRLADGKLKSVAVTENVGYAPLEGSLNDYKPFLFVMGFSDEAFETLPLKLVSGRMPMNSSELVISEHTIINGGVSFALGDKLTLELGSRVYGEKRLWQENNFLMEYQENTGEYIPMETFMPRTTKTYTVVGICKRPDFEDYAAPGYTAITLIDTQALGGTGGTGGTGSAGGSKGGSVSFSVYTTLKQPGKVYDYIQAVSEGEYSPVLNRYYLRFLGISNDDNFNAVLYSMSAILIAMILLGSVLLIYNSFAISVSERSRQFGILSSVGATAKQLRQSVLFEGLYIGAVAIPAGLLVGIAGIGVTLSFVADIFTSITSRSDSGVSLSLSLSPAALLIAAALGIATILISACIPASRAVRKPALDSIRQLDDIKIKAKAVKTSRLTQRLFGLEGTLALKNFKRNRKRYRSTVISLFVSVVLFVSASSFGMYLKAGSGASILSFGYDLKFSLTSSSPLKKDEELIRLYNTLKTAEGIYESSYEVTAFCVSEIPTSLLTNQCLDYYGPDAFSDNVLTTWILVRFIDDATYKRYVSALGLSADEYSPKSGKLLGTAMVSGKSNKGDKSVSFDMFKKNSFSLKVTPIAPSGDVKANPLDIDFTIVKTMPATISESLFSGFYAFAPYSSCPVLGLPEDAFMNMSLYFLSHDPLASETEMVQMVRDSGLTGNYFLSNLAAEMLELRSLLLVINIFVYGFVIMISLIAVANVFNTVSTSINLRRREFAMLRSVGMTNGSFNRMTSFECIFYGMKALLYGLPAAIVVSLIIYLSINQGVELAFMLPWASLGISVFGVFFVVFVSMLYAVRKIRTVNVIDALRDEAA